MRDQPTPACKGNVLYTGVWRSYDISVSAGHGGKVKPDLSKRRDWAGDPGAAGRPEHMARRPCHGSGGGKISPQEECHTGRFCW